MKYRNIFFDMDGTLLDTLEDILTAVNQALKDCGYSKQYKYEDGKKLIGNGAYILAQRALSFINYTEEELITFRERFFDYFIQFQDQTTKPYAGMVELLRELKIKYNLFVISNKPESLLKIICTEKFGKDIFIDVFGHIVGNPEKPDPFGVNSIIKKYCLKREECIYIGDSEVDVNTAKNANIDCCLVTYGYVQYTNELIKKAVFTASNIEELRKLFL